MPYSRIHSMIRAAGARSPRESAELAQTLTARCWPRGGDRRDPVATEWLRRWTPSARHGVTPGCTCAAGRCAWCN